MQNGDFWKKLINAVIAAVSIIADVINSNKEEETK